MPSPTNANINRFIEAKEQTAPSRFTCLLRSIDGVPAGTTGWFYTDLYPLDKTNERHIFKPYNPISPKAWIDQHGTQQIALVRKEDVK